MNVRLIIAIGLVSWGGSAWAINKCTDAKGKIVYQDTACSVEQSQQAINTGGAGAALSQPSAPKSERPAVSQPDRKDTAEKAREPRRVVTGPTSQ